MSVGEVTEYSPESLNEALTALTKLPYSNDERIADIVASSMEFLKNVFIAPISLSMSISNLIQLVSNYRVLTSSCDLLTSDTIPEVVEKYFADSDEKEQISEKLFYVSNKVQEYARKMNLGQVDVYFEKNDGENFTEPAFAGQGISKNIIWIHKEICHDSIEEINDNIAHELSHIKYNHIPKLVGLDIVKSILYVIFLRSLPWVYSIPLIMITNGVASLLFNAFSRRQEKEADKGALDFLQTNTGRIKSTYKHLCENLNIKYASIEDLKKFNPHFSLETLEKLKKNITSIGNIRDDFYHPPQTERLAMALAFVPKAQTPQES